MIDCLRKAFAVFLLAFITVILESNAYVRPQHVDQSVWDDLSPFFLPEDHPAKQKLDAIFADKNCINTVATLKKNGFEIINKPRSAHAVVAKHKKLKGYLIKLFTDDSGVGMEWMNWKKRVLGANYIQEAIHRHGFEHLFVVPKKWIYPLPQPTGKAFVLVVEKINILKVEENVFFWKSIAVTPALLDALAIVLQEEGLIDSIYPSNIPFTKERKVAFIDTEHWHHWPVIFHKLLPFLNPRMQQYWIEHTRFVPQRHRDH